MPRLPCTVQLNMCFRIFIYMSPYMLALYLKKSKQFLMKKFSYSKWFIPIEYIFLFLDENFWKEICFLLQRNIFIKLCIPQMVVHIHMIAILILLYIFIHLINFFSHVLYSLYCFELYIIFPFNFFIYIYCTHVDNLSKIILKKFTFEFIIYISSLCHLVWFFMGKKNIEIRGFLIS